MAKKFADVWEDVEEALENAEGIAFEGCHKIYILMDQKQMELMKEYGYAEEGSFLIPTGEITKAEMLVVLKDWYEKSCALKFIEAVETNEEDPNLGFTHLIPQGYESEFCVSCGDYGTDFDGYCDDCREDWDEDEPEEDEDE